MAAKIAVIATANNISYKLKPEMEYCRFILFPFKMSKSE